MYTRLILLSKLIILLSIAPVRAQYSFEKVIGGTDDDRPSGMKQFSDGYFYLYGSSGSFPVNYGNKNYVAKIDHLGNIIWQRTFTETSQVDRISDVIELPDGSLFCGGRAQEQLQVLNPRVTIITTNGDILLDTLYPMGQNFGYIQTMVNNPEKRIIVSIGIGGIGNNDGLMFQKADYSGKRVWHSFLPYPSEFRTKKIFKMKNKDEYIVFGQKKVLHLDSIGHMIGGEEWALQTPGDIKDIVQNEDGTYTSLVYGLEGKRGFYLQMHNDSGRFLRYSTQLTPPSIDYYFSALTGTKEKGYLAAGWDFYLIDSNEQIVWKKKSGLPEGSETISIKQALDSCYYGCAEDWSKNDSNDPDMYIFKTTVDGEIKSGLNDYSRILKAQVIPNPSQGMFIITGEFKQAQATISNLLGQAVLKSQTISQGGKLDASALENGVYLLKLTSGDKNYVQKVSIVR